MSNATALLARMAAQVRIDPRPAPRNLSESRQILLALQKFGKVLAFRNLKYDLSNKKSNHEGRPIVAILDSAEAAQRAISSSPLTVTILKSPDPPTTSSLSSQIPTTTATPDSYTEAKNITCEITPSTHNHERTIMRNPFRSSYDIDKDTPIYADMTSRETAVPLKELADVLQRPKPCVSYSVEAQTRKTIARMGGHSLRGLWREGLINEEIEQMRRERERERNSKTGFRRVSLRRMRESAAELDEDHR